MNAHFCTIFIIALSQICVRLYFQAHIYFNLCLEIYIWECLCVLPVCVAHYELKWLKYFEIISLWSFYLEKWYFQTPFNFFDQILIIFSAFWRKNMEKYLFWEGTIATDRRTRERAMIILNILVFFKIGDILMSVYLSHVIL